MAAGPPGDPDYWNAPFAPFLRAGEIPGDRSAHHSCRDFIQRGLDALAGSYTFGWVRRAGRTAARRSLSDLRLAAMATMNELAESVRSALATGDLDSYRGLLAPDVHWGAPGTSDSGCRNRDEVLSWFRASRDQGMTATVDEVVAGEGHLLVGLTVSRDGATAARWQVLTVRAARIVDICGFDDRNDAVAYAAARHPGVES